MKTNYPDIYIYIISKIVRLPLIGLALWYCFNMLAYAATITAIRILVNIPPPSICDKTSLAHHNFPEVGRRFPVKENRPVAPPPVLIAKDLPV